MNVTHVANVLIHHLDVIKSFLFRLRLRYDFLLFSLLFHEYAFSLWVISAVAGEQVLRAIVLFNVGNLARCLDSLANADHFLAIL